MVTELEINPLYFLSTAAREFKFSNGVALRNDKTIHTCFIFSFWQSLPQTPISSIIETNQRKLCPAKGSISSTAYTIVYTQTETSQEFSCCAIPYYKIEHLMAQKILRSVINIYQDITSVTLRCCAVKAVEVLINSINATYVKQLPQCICFLKTFNCHKRASVCLHARFNSRLC
jgi:hypothetical protein